MQLVARPSPCLRRNILALISSLAALLADVQSADQPASGVRNGFSDGDLFSSGPVRQIRITIKPEDLNALRTDSRRYVPAIVDDGARVYDPVGIHLKGSTGSFRSIDDKPGFTLDFSRFPGGPGFHGQVKFHLNNSVEDPSYVNEMIGSELFRAAGVPAPRVTHAVVELNGRALGLYVLKEGFTENFLRRYFARSDGKIREDDDLSFGQVPELAPNSPPQVTWAQLEQEIDTERFITFFALEIMLGHRDGYALAGNNFRIYDDPASGKKVFLPHGMDQLFAIPGLSWKPHLAGSAARAVMLAPEGRQQYEARFRELFTRLFVVSQLTNRVNQIVSSLSPNLTHRQLDEIRTAAKEINNRIEKRFASLTQELSAPERQPLQFTGGAAPLRDWIAGDQSEKCKLSEPDRPGGNRLMRIVSDSATSASWRTVASLQPGSYRFEGSIKTAGVTPLPFGRNQGAALRVAGHPERSPGLTGTSTWRTVAVDFVVTREQPEVELVCELRASGGEACFDPDTLRLIITSGGRGAKH